MSTEKLCISRKKHGTKERRTNCLRLRGNMRKIKGMKNNRRKK